MELSAMLSSMEDNLLDFIDTRCQGLELRVYLGCQCQQTVLHANQYLTRESIFVATQIISHLCQRVFVSENYKHC